MKELIQLINYKENKGGNFTHNSSYTLRFGEIGKVKSCDIYCYEFNDGVIENTLYAPEEYYIKLMKSPQLISQLSRYELESLRLIIGRKNDFILYNTDYSPKNITYYFIYNFRKIQVEVDNKINFKVFEDGGLKKLKCKFIAGEDYITLASLVRELFIEREFEHESEDLKVSYIG